MSNFKSILTIGYVKRLEKRIEDLEKQVRELVTYVKNQDRGPREIYFD